MDNLICADRNPVLREAGKTNVLIKFFRSVCRMAVLYRDQRRLEALPDYMLRDIGISRSEIRSAIRLGRRFRDN
jgi:uncharacterized protein YjiS (DUF1127 family)